MKRGINILATTYLATATLAWCSVPVFIKHFTRYFDHYTQNAYRYGVAALLWTPVLWWLWRRGLAPRRLWRQALVPVVCNIIGQTFWALALYYLNPGFMSLCMRISLVWAIIFAMLVFRDERPLLRSVRFWLGVVVGLVGAAGVIGFSDDFSWQARDLMTGLLVVLGCSIFWAGYMVGVRWKMGHVSSLVAFPIIAVSTAIGLVGLMLVFGEPAAIATAPPSVVFWLVLSAIVGIGISHVFYYAAMRRLGAAICAGTLEVVPFLTLGLSWLVFGETLNGQQWLSGAILLAGTGVLIWAQRDVHVGHRPPEPDSQEPTPS